MSRKRQINAKQIIDDCDRESVYLHGAISSLRACVHIATEVGAKEDYLNAAEEALKVLRDREFEVSQVKAKAHRELEQSRKPKS